MATYLIIKGKKMIRYYNYLFPSSTTWYVRIVFFNNCTSIASVLQEVIWCEQFKIMLNMTFLTVLIILSHIPPICGAADGLKYQVICLLDPIWFNFLVVPFRLVPSRCIHLQVSLLYWQIFGICQWNYWCHNLRLLPREWLVW